MTDPAGRSDFFRMLPMRLLAAARLSAAGSPLNTEIAWSLRSTSSGRDGRTAATAAISSAEKPLDA